MVTCCPCGDKCTIASDDFNRSSIGANWTTDAGTWSITTDELTTSDAEARIIYTASDTPSASMVASADVTLASDNDQAVIIVAYVDDEHYLYAELTRANCATCTTSCSTIALFQVDAGTATEILAPANIGVIDYTAAVNFTVCYWADPYPDPGVGILSATAGGNTVYKSGVTSAGLKAGLGTGTNASGVNFDNFTLENSSRYSSGCDKCAQPCETQAEFAADATALATCDFTTTGSPSWVISGISRNYLDFTAAGCVEGIRPTVEPEKIKVTARFKASVDGEVVTITAAGIDLAITVSASAGDVTLNGVSSTQVLNINTDYDVCIQADGDFYMVSIAQLFYSRAVAI